MSRLLLAGSHQRHQGQEALYVANIVSGSMTALDLKEGKAVGTVKTGAGTEGIDVTPDGRQVWITIRAKVTPDGRRAWVAHAEGGAVSVVDLQEGKRTGALTVGKGPDGMGYSAVDVAARPEAAKPS